MLREYIEKYCVNLNIAKMICAFGVLFCHAFAISANQMDYLEKWSNGQTNIGGISVAFFFFISGLYASRSLYSRMNVRDFLQRRFRRMFPQLWVVVFLCVFVLGVGLTSIPLKRYLSTPKTYLYFLNAFAMPYHDLPGVFVNQYYTTINGSLWTIPIELLSYIGISLVFLLGGLWKEEGQRKATVIFHVIGTSIFMSLTIVLMFIEPAGILLRVINPIALFWEGVLFYDFRELISLRWDLGFVSLVGVIFFCLLPGFVWE